MTHAKRYRNHMTTPHIRHPSGVAGISAAMVGRDVALQQLMAQLYTLLEGSGTQLITIIAEAGMGKSRLAHEFYEQVMRLPDAPRFHRFKGDPQRSAQPHGMVRQLIAALFDLDEAESSAATLARLEQGVTALLGPDRLEEAHILGYLVGLDLEESPHLSGLCHDVRQIRERAVQSAMQLIAKLTKHTPMVLLIDDLHDVDDSSVAMIERAAQIGGSINLMLLCLAQRHLFDLHPHWAQTVPGAVRIDLQPLDEHQSRRLVGEILRKAGTLPSDLRNLIVSRAGGNPLYIEELINTLVTDGVIIPGNDTWQIRVGRLPRLRIPTTLADLLRTRLQPLNPIERAFLRAAAVADGVFWASAPAFMLGDAQLDVATIIQSLEQQRLIVAQPESSLRCQQEYRFSHDLLREAIYEQIPAADLHIYHRRLAEWLVASCDDHVMNYAGLIAEHFERGGEQYHAGCWHMQAGAHARTAYALDTAMSHYQLAISLLANLPDANADLIAGHAALGQVQLEAAQFAEAVASFRRARDLASRCGDKQAEAHALERLSAIADDMSDPVSMRNYAQQALELAYEIGDPAQIVMSLATLSLANNRLGETDRGLELAQEALIIAQQAEYDLGVAKSMAYLALAYEHRGDLNAAMEYMQAAMVRFRQLGNLVEVATQLNNLGYIANAQGDFASALTFLEEGLRIAHDGGIRYMEIYLLSNLGAALVGVKRHAEAEAMVKRGIQMCEQSRIKIFPDFYRDLSAIYLAQGRVDEAVEAAQRGLSLAREAGAPREVGVAWRALGMAMADLAEPMGAALCFAESALLLDMPGMIADKGRTLRAWAAHEMRSGDAERGRKLLEQARDLFKQASLSHELERTSIPALPEYPSPLPPPLSGEGAKNS
ncbi:ATP-binding protein [Candidatus Oscillochloris fontis]|uniref:ATP-binding protein n=1 Tax=Candidatus Oscillochloris fontis TaxID=2496868 RepID=UPI00101D336E|nr:tetratricopeptide repeat protein [Candidatus Oscillochloris fontis]